jgi:hypothetical protein
MEIDFHIIRPGSTVYRFLRFFMHTPPLRTRVRATHVALLVQIGAKAFAAASLCWSTRWLRERIIP